MQNNEFVRIMALKQKLSAPQMKSPRVINQISGVSLRGVPHARVWADFFPLRFTIVAHSKQCWDVP